MTNTQSKRCVVYTRKSSDEGLEQEFNSLDAQRESAIAYIQSQRHEGWTAVDTLYDDGGYSGGSMQRPALKRLLIDIEAGLIDAVVVYKVDRLSRSLHDFAQVMQLFDEHHVSFVSVTQPFNTTSSMGRLTLNVLLSFAQFEREVTGERIRDKVAASKQKGLWMGGVVPFGYYLTERRLYPETAEAKQLVDMYTHYAQHGSYLKLLGYCKTQGYYHRAKNPDTLGKPFYRQQLHRLLTSPLYIGKVTHKDNIYEGQHEGIIDQALWDAVQAKMQSQEQKNRHRWQQPYLLKGLLKSSEGFALSPTTLHKPMKAKAPDKKTSHKKRMIRHYTSQKAIQQGYKTCEVKSLNGHTLDDLVRSQIGQYLSTDEKAANNAVIRYLETLPQAEQDFQIRTLIEQVTVSTQKLMIELKPDAIQALRHEVLMALSEALSTTDTLTPLPQARYQPTIIETATTTKVEPKTDLNQSLNSVANPAIHPIIRLVLEIQIKRQGQSRMILTADGKDLVMPKQPKVDEGLVAAICKGQHWRQLMQTHQWSFEALAKHENTDVKNAHGWISLTYLAPAIIKRILQGQHLPSWTLKRLIQAAKLPLWDEQYRCLGIEDQFSTQ